MTAPALQEPDLVTQAHALATAWRIEHGYTGRGGVVVLDGPEVCGWLNELRDPGRWIPGCLAVNEQGDMWEARGGDEATGATLWELIDCSGHGEKVSHRSDARDLSRADQAAGSAAPLRSLVRAAEEVMADPLPVNRTAVFLAGLHGIAKANIALGIPIDLPELMEAIEVVMPHLKETA